MTVLGRNLITGMRLRAGSTALAFVLGLVTVVGTASAQAQTYNESVLYSFTGGSDGANPYAGLILDAKGNLYGTTYYGGASGAGVVFKLSSKDNETVLYPFPGGGDGANPAGGLILDAKGNLYGTTYLGGNLSDCKYLGGGCGVVFKLNSKGNETLLYTFTGKPDGGNAFAGLIRDAAGNLYGTTVEGGGANCTGGCGTVFKLDPTTRKETVLHSFTGGADGRYPYAGLILDAKGNLYGVAEEGGVNHLGTVFKVSSKGKWTVLYSFKATGGDGANPTGCLILDAKGNLYGATDGGGTFGVGTVFKLSSKGKETVLYSFKGTGGDGAYPGFGVTLDASGNLYGTTIWGGSSSCTSGCGIVFKLDPTTRKETVLHSFTGADGANPFTGLIMDAKGNFYGTTYAGGNLSLCTGNPYGGTGCGVVFKVSSKGE